MQFLEVAPEQGVVGHHDIVLRDLLARDVPRRAAFHHQHFEMGCETVGLAPPIVQHRSRADYQGGFRIFSVAFFEPGQPGESLQRFAQPHVVSQNSPEPDLRQVRQEVESVLLIGPHFSLNAARQGRARNSLETRKALAQGLGLR